MNKNVARAALSAAIIKLGSAAVSLAAAISTPAIAQTAANSEATPAQTPQDVMMVLDGSGSMWGQIDGVAKITIAKKVIGDLLDDWDPSMNLGLMAYGHRVKGDCADIELLAPVAPVDKAAIMAKVEPINPKGKTPITASVRQAAEHLKYKEQKSTVILVSDGLETCDADPCALSKELEEAGVDFTTHVIGFDLKQEEFESLQCIAEATGGAFINANNADELSEALEQTVEATKASANLGLRLYAKPCESCAPFGDVSFQWRVYGVDADGVKTGEEIDGAVTQGGFVALEPGRYYVEGWINAQSALAASAVVTIGDETTTEHSLIIPAGKLVLSALLTEAGAPITSDMYYEVFSAPDAESGERTRVATGVAAESTVWVMADDDLLVTAKHGVIKEEMAASLEPGAAKPVVFVMNIGHLVASATLYTGGPLSGGSNLWVNRAEDGANFDKKLYFKIGSKQRFPLKEGEYLLTGQYQAARNDMSVSVTAGEVSETVVNIGAGTVQFSAGYSKQELLGGLFWRITDRDGARVTEAASAQPKLWLTAGDYVATAHKGSEKARVEFTVIEGETVEAFAVFPKP